MDVLAQPNNRRVVSQRLGPLVGRDTECVAEAHARHPRPPTDNLTSCRPHVVLGRHGAVYNDGAMVESARCHSDQGAPGPGVDRGQCPPHLARRAATVAPSPTLRDGLTRARWLRQHRRAGCGSARGQGNDFADVPQVDLRPGVSARGSAAALTRLAAGRVRVLNSELTDLVSSPANHSVVDRTRARMQATANHLDGPKLSERHRRQRIIHLCWSCTPRPSVRQAENAIPPQPEAFYCAAINQHAGMRGAGSHREGVHAGPQVYRLEGFAKLGRLVTAELSIRVSGLPVRAGTPAPNRPAPGHRTRVLITQ